MRRRRAFRRFARCELLPRRFAGRVHFTCRVDNPSGRVLVNLADFSQPLEGIERGELTFRVTNFGPAAQVPGVDRVETQATASRTWAVPLE